MDKLSILRQQHQNLLNDWKSEVVLRGNASTEARGSHVNRVVRLNEEIATVECEIKDEE